MSNPNLGFVPVGAGLINDQDSEDKDATAAAEPDANVDAEVEEDEATRDQDLAEGDAVNERLDE